MKLPKRERLARLLTRRRNQLLRACEEYILAGEAHDDPLGVVRAMIAYVELLPLPPRKRALLAAASPATKAAGLAVAHEIYVPQAKP